MDSLESILFLTLSYIRDQIHMNDASRIESIRRTVIFALDQTRLDGLVSQSLFGRLKIIPFRLVSELKCVLFFYAGHQVEHCHRRR